MQHYEVTGWTLAQPKTRRSFTAECSLPSDSLALVLNWSEVIYQIQKYTQWIIWQSFILKPNCIFPIKVRQGWKRAHGNACFACCFPRFPITAYELAFGFRDCFAESWNTSMTWMRNVFLFSCPEKSIYDEEAWYACLLHPCGEQEKTFITALLCADKVSLFIQSRGDKHWMKQCGTEREKERRERDGGIKGGERTRKQLGSQLPVCVSMWADGIYPCAARVLGGWPLLYSNIPPSHHYLLPPTATFLAFMFPLTLLIHSHYETACIMLFNENNPQGDGASYIQ